MESKWFGCRLSGCTGCTLRFHMGDVVWSRPCVCRLEADTILFSGTECGATTRGENNSCRTDSIACWFTLAARANQVCRAITWVFECFSSSFGLYYSSLIYCLIGSSTNVDHTASCPVCGTYFAVWCHLYHNVKQATVT